MESVYRELHGKKDARQLLNVAKRKGVIIQKSCESCGDIKSEGHHTDYGQPLEVIWLCRKHHREWHKKNGCPIGVSYFVRLTENQDKEVKAISKKEGVSVAEVCRALIEAALIEMHNKS